MLLAGIHVRVPRGLMSAIWQARHTLGVPTDSLVLLEALRVFMRVHTMRKKGYEFFAELPNHLRMRELDIDVTEAMYAHTPRCVLLFWSAHVPFTLLPESAHILRELRTEFPEVGEEQLCIAALRVLDCLLSCWEEHFVMRAEHPVTGDLQQISF